MNFDEREYHSLILGGLLHDIGKFIQKPEGRSKTHPDDGAKFLSPYADSINSIGFDFSLVNCIVSMHQKGRWKEIADPRKKSLVCNVATSDCFASGERDYEWAEEESESLSYYPLDPVFGYINLGVEKDTEAVKNYKAENYHYRHKEISFEDIFPSTDPLPKYDKEKDMIKGNYNELRKGFVQEFERTLNSTNSIQNEAQRTNAFLVSLYSLLCKYMWCIPDDVGRKIRDISLFDHTRISAAIAACLYIYQYKEKSLDDIEKIGDRDVNKFLLIAGDLSGIQDYLFNITNIGIGGVAKRLRARSFFLNSLVEVISHRILQESVGYNIKLPLLCKIMASGGNFIILAPKIEHVEKEIFVIRETVNRWLFKEFQGDLSFSFASLPIAGRDLEIKRKETVKTRAHESYITERLGELRKILELEKTRKLSAFLVATKGSSQETRFGWNTDSFVWGYKTFPYGDCPSCRKNPATADTETPVDDRLCERCDSDRRFSEHLAKAKYISYTRESPTNNSNTYTFFEEGERYWVSVSKNWEDIPLAAYLVQTMDPATTLYEKPCFFNPYANYVPLFENQSDLENCCKTFCYKDLPSECEFYRSLTDPGFQTKTGIRPSGFPAVKPFECLAASSDGEKLMGILKADVDSFRLIFSEGLGEERTSLSRVATLSRMTDLFFSGLIDYVLRNNPTFKGTYTVYSGGDDLLVAGPWDKIILLSQIIAEKFRAYVACNPQVTISAGIAVTKPKFPIAKSSMLAGHYLNKAKEGEELTVTNKERQKKNRLYLFGTSSVWFKRREEEIEAVKLIQWGEKILNAMMTKDMDKRLSGGVVYSLLRFSTMCKEWLENQEIDDLRYLPLMAYTIGRNVKDEITMRELKDLIDNIDKQGLFSKFRMPITWALLNYRGRRE